NHMNIDAMLADQSGRFGAGTYALLAGMPLLYCATWLVTRRSERFRQDVALQRRKTALRHAHHAIDRAVRQNSPSGIGHAVLKYIADRVNVPAGGVVRADAMALLSERGVPEATRREADQLLE